MREMTEKAIKYKCEISIYFFTIAIAGLLFVNWNEYGWYQIALKYNDIVYALVITIVLFLGTEYKTVDELKKDKLLASVIVICVMSFLLLLAGQRGLRELVTLYDYLMSLYVADRCIIKEKARRPIIAVCIIVAVFFFYWTIDVKGYYKGYSINYGGLVLLSGFVFLLISVEYIKKKLLESTTENSIVV